MPSRGGAAAMSATVASPGSAAAYPGTGVVGPTTKTATSSPTAPTTASHGRDRTVGTSSTSSAPMPSPHARASDEKYADAGFVAVRYTDHAKDAATTTAASTVSTRRTGHRRDSAAASTSRVSVGQTK